jgi:outer membrane protein assembly factor BamD
LSLDNVPTAASAPNASSAVDSSVSVAAPATPAGGGTGVGIEIVQPSGDRQTPAKPGNTTFPGATPASGDPAPQSASPQPAPVNNGGLAPVGPPASQQLAPIQHADQAPDPINEVKPASQPQPTQTAANGKKNPKPVYDSDQESSSKHKPKKGLKKLNPL